MKIGPHTMSRGQLIGSPIIAKTPGKANEDGAGGVVVAEGNFVARYFNYKANLPRSEAEKVAYYIENSLRFWGEIVTVVDGFGVSRQCRYWKDEIRWTPIGGDMVSVDWPFRVEVT